MTWGNALLLGVIDIGGVGEHESVSGIGHDAAALLNWLRERGQSLATCTQDDIDDWLALDPFSRSRGFVTWAVGRNHARNIEVPPSNNSPVREVFTEHDQRWALARRLLDDGSIEVADRVAGLLILLYAQRVVRITRLTSNHVIVTNDGVALLLGEEPIDLPAAVADLVLALLDRRRGAAATAPDNGVWLYPAHRLGQPLAPRDLVRRLILQPQLMIRVGSGRVV